jgi:hypothetical protein
MTAAEGRRRETWGERFARAASVFLDKRVIILLLGFSSGLPLALSGYAPLTLDSDCESPQREFALG